MVLVNKMDTLGRSAPRASVSSGVMSAIGQDRDSINTDKSLVELQESTIDELTRIIESAYPDVALYEISI